MTSSPRSERVGLREVAAAAGVCLMTVSLSLRNSPKISAATRERVRGCAAQLGYRPDPEISRLMGRLRQSRKARGSEVIAMLDVRAALGTRAHPYDLSLQKGIERRADALGFGTSLFRLAEYGGNLPKLVRVLRTRGIEGLIFLPSSQGPVALDPTVVWDGLSVISATNVVLTPRFNQVLPNQFGNMMTLLELVHRQGFKRVGAVIGESMEARNRHHYSAALTWHGHRERIFVLPGISTVAENAATVTAWLREHRPEIVLAQHAHEVVPLLKAARLPARTALVSLSGRTHARLPFQDQLPELVGDTAARLVTGMMHNHETGIPEHPQVTLIDGRYCDPREAAAPAPQ